MTPLLLGKIAIGYRKFAKDLPSKGANSMLVTTFVSMSFSTRVRVSESVFFFDSKTKVAPNVAVPSDASQLQLRTAIPRDSNMASNLTSAPLRDFPLIRHSQNPSPVDEFLARITGRFAVLSLLSAYNKKYEKQLTILELSPFCFPSTYVKSLSIVRKRRQFSRNPAFALKSLYLLRIAKRPGIVYEPRRISLLDHWNRIPDLVARTGLQFDIAKGFRLRPCNLEI